MNTNQLLKFLYKRLVYKHHEPQEADYMEQLIQVIAEVKEPNTFESLLKADIEETLHDHYDFTLKEIKQFLHMNLDHLIEESYKAQTDHLLNAVNKFERETK